jgi:hypothetical protein
MEQKISTIQRFRWWLLISFICSNAFIAGNALLSSDESGDLSTGISETLINIARAVLPPAEVVTISSMGVERLFVSLSSLTTPDASLRK